MTMHLDRILYHFVQSNPINYLIYSILFLIIYIYLYFYSSKVALAGMKVEPNLFSKKIAEFQLPFCEKLKEKFGKKGSKKEGLERISSYVIYVFALIDVNADVKMSFFAD